MDELMAQFVVEALELTQQAAEDLIALEREPDSRPHIESAFRAFHTLKGSAGLFDLAPMTTTLHAAEDVLAAANQNGGELDLSRIDPLLAVIEWTERCVHELARTGTLDASEAAVARELMAGLAKQAPQPRQVGPSATGAIPDWARLLFADAPELATVAIRYAPAPECFFNGDDPIAIMGSVPELVSLGVDVREPWPEPQKFDPFRSNLVFEALSGASRKDIEAAFRLIPDQVAIVSRPSAATGVTTDAVAVEPPRTVRVEIGRIDSLLDSVGELFTANNTMSKLVREARQLDGGLALARAIVAAQQEFERLASQIQRAATGIRMVPLNETLRRLPRLVREVSSQTGKPVDLAVGGGELEADKAIVDGLFDPLLHVLRNAIDHGIEGPAARRTAGKSERGKIALRARQVGYRIELEISDDGRGLDLERIRNLAVSRGLLDQRDADGMTDEDTQELIFRSGFSTASSVTGVSGRGVGMDAVRTAVQRLGGRVNIRSAPGVGATVVLSLPTNFAMSRIMIVDAAGDPYGVAMDAVSETTRIPAHAIVPIRAGEAFVLRDRTLPLVRLSQLLGSKNKSGGDALVLVTDIGGSRVGLAVDGIGERFETMLRPPSGLLKVVPGISGTAVLGDGRVIMVLDLEALIR